MNKANQVKTSVGILFGGVSSEYEVSLMSAAAVLENIDTNRFNPYCIGIKKDGKMFLYNGDVEKIKDNSWFNSDCTPCVISTDRTHHGILVFDEENRAEVIALDAAFPVLHGKNGEDGTMQGLLSIAGIPFVGCNTLASAACMDKDVTHTLLDSVAIPVAKWVSAIKHIYEKNHFVFLDEVETVLGYPCFVKPANAGSSVGITKASDRLSLEKAIERAFLHDNKVIIEEQINGLELECAVLGNEDPFVSCVGEIEPCNELYDYEAKYLDGKTKTYLPARIEKKDSDAVRAMEIGRAHV